MSPTHRTKKSHEIFRAGRDSVWPKLLEIALRSPSRAPRNHQVTIWWSVWLWTGLKARQEIAVMYLIGGSAAGSRFGTPSGRSYLPKLRRRVRKRMLRSANLLRHLAEKQFREAKFSACLDLPAEKACGRNWAYLI